MVCPLRVVEVKWVVEVYICIVVILLILVCYGNEVTDSLWYDVSTYIYIWMTGRLTLMKRLMRSKFNVWICTLFCMENNIACYEIYHYYIGPLFTLNIGCKESIRNIFTKFVIPLIPFVILLTWFNVALRLPTQHCPRHNTFCRRKNVFLQIWRTL